MSKVRDLLRLFEEDLGVVPHSELAMHTKIAGKPIKKYEIVSPNSAKVWIQDDHAPVSGLPSEILSFEIRRKEGLIEALDLKINGFEKKSHGPFGYNHIANIDYNGKNYNAIKQGGLGFWAFSERPKMSKEDAKLLDARLDAALKAHLDKKTEEVEVVDPEDNKKAYNSYKIAHKNVAQLIFDLDNQFSKFENPESYNALTDYQGELNDLNALKDKLK